jgi:hypothetical protein
LRVKITRSLQEEIDAPVWLRQNAAAQTLVAKGWLNSIRTADNVSWRLDPLAEAVRKSLDRLFFGRIPEDTDEIRKADGAGFAEFTDDELQDAFVYLSRWTNAARQAEQ